MLGQITCRVGSAGGEAETPLKKHPRGFLPSKRERRRLYFVSAMTLDKGGLMITCRLDPLMSAAI